MIQSAYIIVVLIFCWFLESYRSEKAEYFERFSLENGSIFLFNGYTGEAIYDVDPSGAPLPGARRSSHWFEPTAVVPAGVECPSSRRVDIRNLRDLLKDFPGSEYRAQWHATEILQRNFRSASARWKVARAICNAWIKTYDEHAGRYVFTHSSTGDTQYHKPWGMGLSDLWALPGDKVNETLLSLFLRVGVENTQGGNVESEDTRSWEDSKRHRHRLYRFYEERKFMEGPHYRVCGPGNTKESALTNVFLYPKKFHKVRPFVHPGERQFEGTRMGKVLPCMDGLVEKKITADPYFHVRNASEHGSLNVLKVMSLYRNDLRVQGIGLQCIAGSLLEEDEAGGPTEGQKKYLAMALELLISYPDVEWIQAEACAAIASLSSELSMRTHMEREHVHWLEDVVTAMMNVKVVTRVVKELDHSGKESRYEVSVPSHTAPLIALHGCRILANMACDEHNRIDVARNSIAAVVHVAKLIVDDPVLACAVSTSIYNFVSRKEIAHGLVVEAGAYEALEGMLNKLDPNDLKEREMVSRALTALEPDGWRGVDYGLREKDIQISEDSTTCTNSASISWGEGGSPDDNTAVYSTTTSH